MNKYECNKIEGWMSEEELLWLFETAKNYQKIVEIGSFKGRSAHALLSGTSGTVTCIDNWELHWDKNNPHNGDKVFSEFKENLKDFTNLFIIKDISNNAVQKFEEREIDLVFLDFTTNYNEYLRAIKDWSPKTKLICGHEYSDKFPGVLKSVNEFFGKPDGVIGMIWYKYL